MSPEKIEADVTRRRRLRGGALTAGLATLLVLMLVSAAPAQANATTKEAFRVLGAIYHLRLSGTDSSRGVSGEVELNLYDSGAWDLYATGRNSHRYSRKVHWVCTVKGAYSFDTGEQESITLRTDTRKIPGGSVTRSLDISGTNAQLTAGFLDGAYEIGGGECDIVVG